MLLGSGDISCQRLSQPALNDPCIMWNQPGVHPPLTPFVCVVCNDICPLGAATATPSANRSSLGLTFAWGFLAGRHHSCCVRWMTPLTFNSLTPSQFPMPQGCLHFCTSYYATTAIYFPCSLLYHTLLRMSLRTHSETQTEVSLAKCLPDLKNVNQSHGSEAKRWVSARRYDRPLYCSALLLFSAAFMIRCWPSQGESRTAWPASPGRR